jgi:anti-sigma B factor antagonist
LSSPDVRALSQGAAEIIPQNQRDEALAILSLSGKGGCQEMSCSRFSPHSRIVSASLEERILDFSATIRHSGQASLIDLRGRLTFFEVGILRENVTRLLREGHKQIVLNLSALQYLDSSGVGELARMYVMVLKGGGEMKVVGLSRNVENILKVTHLYQIFPEFPDEEAALESFPRSGADKSTGNTQ